MRTERIRLGTMLTPPSRMRPWKLASETATLDNLSGGRVILSVGLGAIDTGFDSFGETIDRKTRAELMDESLDILIGLWKGQPFSYTGKHYQIKPTTFMVPPPPIQQPRIPIWVVGAWPYERSMRRAVKYDGLLPMYFDEQRVPRQAPVQMLPEIKSYVSSMRNSIDAYDIIVEGTTPPEERARASEILQPWHAAGATWWIETMWDTPADSDGAQAVRRRIQAGPPAF